MVGFVGWVGWSSSDSYLWVQVSSLWMVGEGILQLLLGGLGRGDVGALGGSYR